MIYSLKNLDYSKLDIRIGFYRIALPVAIHRISCVILNVKYLIGTLPIVGGGNDESRF